MAKYLILTLGIATGLVTGYGALEYATAIEGEGVTYLKCALVLVAVGATFTPSCAEVAWRAGQRVRAVLWLVAFVPCAATVFYSAIERVHHAKAGEQAELSAMAQAVTLAEGALNDAKAKADKAEADARAARRLPKAPTSSKAKAGTWCDDACLKRWTDEASEARERVAKAQAEVIKARAKAKAENSTPLPQWLMPLSLDAISLLAFWTVAGLFSRQAEQQPEGETRQEGRKPPTKRARPAKSLPARSAKRTRGLFLNWRRKGPSLRIVPGGRN